MTLPLQAVSDPATDQNFRQIAEHFGEMPNSFLLKEQEAPAAPGPNQVRIYARDNGGKTQLVALFSTGEPQVIATQP